MTSLENPSPGSTPRKRSLRLRAVLMALGLIAAACIVYLPPIRSWLSDSQRVRQFIEPLGLWSWPISVLAVAILVGCGGPRLIFCTFSGMIFGFWSGLLITTLGSLLGYYVVFLFVRWGGRDWVLNHWPRLRKWAGVIHDHGIVGVILVRQLPVPGAFTNMLLGLSHVRHRQFLIGTAIGLLPEAIPLTLVGTGLVKSSLKASVVYIVAAVAIFALIWIACGYVFRKLKTTHEGAAMMHEVEALTGREEK